MTHTYKQQLLQETLNQSFEMERFVRFVSEFFNDVQMTNQYVPDVRIWGEYREQIKSFTRVGRYIDSNKKKVDIFAIEVSRESTVERARSLQRNFVSRLITGTATAAIVAFYDPNSENWRLSFVKLDYAFTPKGVKVEVTPAKRYSYLVGKGEGIHTVQRQLLPIFENERENPTVEQIEEAFSVETVTKEFFNSYKDEYLRLKEYLEGNEVFLETAEKNNFTSEQFAKKLMGQLAFLYFLQKKGWLGVGVAPKELSKDEFIKIYEEQKSDAREVFAQHYLLAQDGRYKRYKVEDLEKDKYKADLFAGCFKGTKFYNPWGKGNTSFIRSIYTNCVKRDKKFFDDYLEPLFYNALNNPRGENDYFPRFNSKIPFLNGGLFEPLFANWEAIDFNIPNSIFSKEGIDSKEDGILDVFDTFNFTINEDEPLEREVAVDPEMLGKIFENLLDVKDRKSKGAFYTPREIVHYMCQESLINYLVNETSVPYEDMKQFVLYGEVMTNQDSSKKTLDGEQVRLIPLSIFEKLDSIDEKLDSVRIADPAVGSGAFPLGILNEIVKLRNNITQYKLNRIPREFRMERAGLLKERNPYKLKWNTIQNCIFAVDIEASAVDITKLRLWLSLIVDQQIDDVNEKPHALPNLDCNIMCGNSLIEEFEGIQLFDEKLLEQVDLSKPLQQKVANVTQLTLDTAKQEQELDTMFKELFAMQGGLFGEDDPTRKKEIKDKIEKKTSDIIDYKLNGIDKNHEAARRYHKSIQNHEKPYFLWKLEFARVFKEKEGFDIIIGNPPYVFAREKISDQEKEVYYKFKTAEYQLNTFVLFIEKAIDLLKHTGELAFIIPNSILKVTSMTKIRKYILDNSHLSNVLQIFGYSFENVNVETVVLILEKGSVKNKVVEVINVDKVCDISMQNRQFIDYTRWTEDPECRFQISINKDDDEIINKIIERGKVLKEYFEVKAGLQAYEKGKGLPKQTAEDVKNRPYDADTKLNNNTYPYLEGKNVQRYSFNWEGKWLQYGTMLAAPRMFEIFNSPRILVREITSTHPKSLLCTYMEDIYLNNRSIINILSKSNNKLELKCLLGLLNSNLISYYFNKITSKADRKMFPKVILKDLKEFPIIIPDDKEALVTIVDKLLSLYSTNKSRDIEVVQALERELNVMIYSLYDLSKEDISVIEK